jgi:glyoxylase-like metal-dependent hydrolase (beta-lactamase superfamily II)
MNLHLKTRCLVILTLVLGSAQAVEIRFEPVAPGIYAHVGDTDGRTYENEAINANFGLVVTPAGAVLIDAGASLQGARQIVQAARRVTAQPIRWVINTGTQDHRWLGNGYFKEQGAQIIAHAGGQADMQDRGGQQLDSLRAVLKEKLEGTVPTLPSRWLVEPDNRLDLGGTVLELKYRQGAHTPGDMLVWLPQQGVVFTGDVVYVERILGLLPVSNTRHWLESFAVLDELQPRVVVPGHGRLSDLATARADTRDLLLALRRHMGPAVQAGTELSTAVKSFDGQPFKRLQHAEVWLPQLANLTYLEMERE